MDNSGQKSGGREQTRARLVEIFNKLLLEGGSPRPRVSQVVGQANVARSTFYDHFDGIEALANESLAELLGAMTDSLLGDESEAKLIAILEHVHQNRRLGRDLLTGARGERSEALLAKIVESRLADERNRRLSAILISGTVISALGGWTSGRLNAAPNELATTLRRATQAILASSLER